MNERGSHSAKLLQPPCGHIDWHSLGVFMNQLKGGPNGFCLISGLLFYKF